LKPGPVNAAMAREVADAPFAARLVLKDGMKLGYQDAGTLRC